jgi:hypothetical protein
MQTVNITLSDEDHRALSGEYRNATLEQLRASSDVQPFEQWLAARVVRASNAVAEVQASPTAEADEVRAFDAIEKLITSLRQHSFGLAWMGKYGEELSDSASELAATLVKDLSLPRQQTRRIEELLEYYGKSAKDIADAARVVVTNRAYGAMHEAFRELVERTEKADHLDEGQALGRVEGAAAMLVSMRVLNREAAKEKTDAFRQQLRDRKK